MKVIRLSASFIFVATVIVVVSSLAHTTETRDLSHGNRTVVATTKLSVAKTQRSLAPLTEPSVTPVDAAYATHSDGSGASLSGDSGLGSAPRRYALGSAETLAFGIVLLVGGGFLRRRRRTDED